MSDFFNNLRDIFNRLQLPAVQSSTASVVMNRGNISNEMLDLNEHLRHWRARNSRSEWQDARMVAYLPGSQAIHLNNFDLCTENYWRELLLAASTYGIWNCQEFADFALIVLDKSKILDRHGYKAEVCLLNNPRTPEGMQNHDHVVVIVTDRQGNQEFVVDLWQKMLDNNNHCVYKYGNFFRMLASNPDGRYVRANVAYNHTMPQREQHGRSDAGGIPYTPQLNSTNNIMPYVQSGTSYRIYPPPQQQQYKRISPSRPTGM